jgi:plasmid replication initiation protein
MSTELIIIKSNYVNEYRYTLNREEQKLLLYVISQIRENEEIYKKGFTINLVDLFNVLKLKNTGDKYNQIASMTKKIMEPAMVKTENEIALIVFFTSFIYNKKEGSVNVKMNPDLIEHFIDLKKHFVKYKLSNILTLKSIYAIRIYELLKQNLFKSKIIYSLVDLKELLGIDSSEYKRPIDFKRRVLDTAFLEINKKTDIKFTFTEIRTGRSVTSIEFEIGDNTFNESETMSMDTGELVTNKPIQTPNTPLISTPNTLNISKDELAQKALSFNIPDHLINKWIDLKGIDIVNQKLELLVTRSKTQTIASPVGFFISAIQQDWKDETKINNKLTGQQEKEQRKKNPTTVMIEPLNFKDEIAFYEELGRLQSDFYNPRWIERDMEQAERNWAKQMEV